jgi:2-polyprenyl-3-methyl-5-hydroxy-6-metoxy-1,4-benzoquinol methylase
MQATCDLCAREMLDFVYAPERSARGLEVHLCLHCGLVQSLPRIARTQKRAPAAISGGADWGNVRYGKGFRTQAALDALARHADLSGTLALLDVGSNRGSFTRAFLDAAPNAAITAVEPDERFAASCADLERTSLLNARIEDVAFPDETFDIIHSCHTIEHLADPAKVLADHARLLKPDGLLLLDAPNIALIGSDDILEEWFIDKHLYHFSETTLARMIEAAGFTIVQAPDLKDAINLLFVARKSGTPKKPIPFDPYEVATAQGRIARYRFQRTENLAALALAARELTALKPRRVALWGAGRLFDALVTHGGFDPAVLSLLIDKHLKQHTPTRHGRALAAPEDLSDAGADVVVVMSRGFAREIAAEAKRRAPRAEIILYADLLARARRRQAA